MESDWNRLEAVELPQCGQYDGLPFKCNLIGGGGNKWKQTFPLRCSSTLSQFGMSLCVPWAALRYWDRARSDRLAATTANTISGLHD